MGKLGLLLGIFIFLAGCSGGAAGQAGATPGTGVTAAETFLADIAQHVAGERVQVNALIPVGVDPHTFEPTPQDIARLAGSRALIVNGAGYESWLQKTLENVGGKQAVIVASQGLTGRTPGAGEAADPAQGEDPHFWMNPLNAVQYVENIRDGLVQVDPDGKDAYTQNAAAYIQQLKDLDAWIRQQVEQIPPERRSLVTNHESLGYFADRYGFQITGAVIPSVSSEASPSARQLAALVERIRAAHVPAIFLESGANPQLAQQVAQETGVKVITGLYVESLTGPDGPAPTYMDMLKHDTQLIVEALK